MFGLTHLLQSRSAIPTVSLQHDVSPSNMRSRKFPTTPSTPNCKVVTSGVMQLCAPLALGNHCTCATAGSASASMLTGSAPKRHRSSDATAGSASASMPAGSAPKRHRSSDATAGSASASMPTGSAPKQHRRSGATAGFVSASMPAGSAPKQHTVVQQRRLLQSTAAQNEYPERSDPRSRCKVVFDSDGEGACAQPALGKQQCTCQVMT